MEIVSVKQLSNGWLLNGTMSVPDAVGNSEREAIKQWLSEGNTPEPEFTQEELDAQAIAKEKQEAQAYLISTDWYIVRFADTGVEIPQEVKDKRAEARLKL